MINTLSALTCELVDEYSNSPVSDVQAENFFFQVNFINCYLREIIRFTKKIDIRDWGQSKASTASAILPGLHGSLQRMNICIAGVKGNLHN